MIQKKKRFTWTLALLLTMFSMVCWAGKGNDKAEVPAARKGRLAPPFVLTSPDGSAETDLTSFRGRRPVVLFFGSYT